MTLAHAIQQLEKAAGIDNQRSRAEISIACLEAGREQSRIYLTWLRNRAPFTSGFIPEWDKLTHKPAPSADPELEKAQATLAAIAALAETA